MHLAKIVRVLLVRIFSFFLYSKRSKVIYYHDIHSVSKYTSMSTSIDLFKEHVDIIRDNGYQIVSEITRKDRQIEICFDDAFLGIYDHIEFFKQNNIHIHLFVIPSYIGKRNYINQTQLLELNKLEIIKISSHTYTHRILSDMKTEEIEEELRNSKDFLESLLDKNVDSICYPEGKYNSQTVDVANAVGYNKQYSSIPGFFDHAVMKNVIKRSLVQFAKKAEFKAILRGGDHILSLWYKIKHFRR